MVLEAGVGGGVLDDESILLLDGPAGEGDIAGEGLGFESDPAFDPVSVVVDESDHGAGDLADLGCEAGEVIEGLFGRGIEDIVAIEGLEALLFLAGVGCVFHDRMGVPLAGMAPNLGYGAEGLNESLEVKTLLNSHGVEARLARMPQGSTSQQGVESAFGGRDSYLSALRWMVLARVLDDKLAALYRAGKIFGGVFLGRGQEALSVSIGMHLRRGDVFAPLIRDLAGRLAFGEEILDVLRTALGSALGPMRGRDGNVHRGRIDQGILPMISHLGAMIAVTNGTLFARRWRGESEFVGVTTLGEGGTSTGAFHEALNQAAVERLPLVLVVANNQYAYSTPNSRQFACRRLVDRAAGYGVAGHEVDGTDLEACLKVVGGAIEAARRGGGPQLIEADLLRLCGHGEHDDASYIDPSMKESAVGRDCLKVAEARALGDGWVSVDVLAKWRGEAVRRVEEALSLVQREPAPDPFKEDWSALSTSRLVEGGGVSV
jgi:pyruvate dehydrogenase E1 component alpha subunit/2-oxoisovalerate dehydrogenase E1 component alpha subunit